MSVLLLSSLDNQLPWLITIRLRNFFSYFYITSPVDDRVKELRVLTNAALLDSNDKRYKTCFENNYNYFTRVFKFSDELLKPKVIPLVSSYTVLSDGLRTPTPPSISEQYLEHIRSGLLKENYTAELKAYLDILGPQEKLIFLQVFTEEAYTHRYDEKIQAVYLDIMQQNFTNDVLVQHVFSNLDTEKALHQYKHYLTLLDDKQRGLLVSCFTALHRETRPICSVQSYQKAMSEMDHIVIKIQSNHEIWRQVIDLNGLEEKLITHHQHDIFNGSRIQNLISQIKTCLEALKIIIHQYHAHPALLKLDRDAEVAARQESRREDARSDFMHKLLHYEVMSVSTQRLEELYPGEAEREQKRIQCEKFGVTIFDANDEDARKKAIQYQEVLKQTTHSFT
jgi:hypothetical protein